MSQLGEGPDAGAAGAGAGLLPAAHLPAGLPVLPRVRVAACYRPAGPDQVAGGGWFDAVPLPGAVVALAAGTVAGAGAAATVAMGQLRAVLTELLTAEPELAIAAGRADRFASRVPELGGASLVLAVLSPGDGRVRYATWGHPPPVIASAGGGARYLPVTGAGPLGMGAEPELASDRLQPGDLLLLSAGLASEPGQTLDDALAGLAGAAAAARAGPGPVPGTAGSLPDRVCQHVASLLARAGGPGDAITVAAEWRPSAAPALNLDLASSPASLRMARHALDEWLSQLDPLVHDQYTLQLAVGEIVANAIEHAYPPGQPGRISLQAALGDDGVLECRVADRGSWKAPDPGDPGRGAGLMLVGRMIDRLEVRHPPQPPDAPPGARGTVVTLRHRLWRPATMIPAASPALPVRAASPPFEVDSGADGSMVWAIVRGPVDLATASSLRSQLLMASRGGTLPLSVDLTEVSQLGNAGVHVLYQVKEQLAVYHQALELIAAPGSVAAAALGLAALRPAPGQPQRARPGP